MSVRFTKVADFGVVVCSNVFVVATNRSVASDFKTEFYSFLVQ